MNQAKQAVNPYLPSYEYVPDGEPHVFNGRVYVYGSHDRFGGDDFCLNDYVCWSACSAIFARNGRGQRFRSRAINVRRTFIAPFGQNS